MSALLEIRGLSLRYPNAHGAFEALSDLDLEVAAGQCVGLVGESGAGKTALLLAILGLLPPQARLAGSIRYRGTELIGLSTARFNEIRGARISMVFQDPMSALNPYMRVIDQLVEGDRLQFEAQRTRMDPRQLEQVIDEPG